MEILGGEVALTGCTTGEVDLSGSATTVRLTDCTVKSSGHAGINVSYGGTAELTRCTVTGVDSGIWIWNSNLTVHSGSFTGTGEVAITAVTLGGIMDADKGIVYAVPSCGGRTDGADAGVYASVTLPRLELGGYPARNYTLIQPTGPFPVSVTIEKAALSAKTGALDVVNRQAHTYTYGLDALLPDLPEGMRFGPGAVTYELADVSLGGYYTGGPTSSAAALTYGQPLSTITLCGNMADGATPVPGTFTWSSPDNRPAVQEKYAAAWTFKPDDNDTYAIVTGTVLIQVLPAPITDAVIVLEPAAFR